MQLYRYAAGVDGDGFTYWFHDDIRGTGPRLYRAGAPTYNKYDSRGALVDGNAAAAAAGGAYHLLTIVHSLYKSSTELFYILLEVPLKRPR